jgi:hypothetical protein
MQTDSKRRMTTHLLILLEIAGLKNTQTLFVTKPNEPSGTLKQTPTLTYEEKDQT